MKTCVLVIEDNEQNCYLLTFLLERSGYEVVAARDGRRGISLAQARPPAIILLDIQLPTMDGYAVANALRRIESLAEVPIVAVTSYAMPGDREKAIEAGCTGYLEKPIDPDRFIEQVEEFLLPAALVPRSSQ